MARHKRTSGHEARAIESTRLRGRDPRLIGAARGPTPSPSLQGPRGSTHHVAATQPAGSEPVLPAATHPPSDAPTRTADPVRRGRGMPRGRMHGKALSSLVHQEKKEKKASHMADRRARAARARLLLPHGVDVGGTVTLVVAE
ncbi:hypothetical protein E4U53_003485 [Claviceps sorghi]|nr:hypothetical protein E4U53_003485 [Claviceps sorghi]